ncbi:MAG: hypothetical protein Q8P20_07880 [bacterium]|nr:hypothetical protein [bacterium]
MALKDWRTEWKKGNTIRYWGSKAHHEMQVGKYRDADDFDKTMGDKYKWHGKWYVDFMSNNRKTRLFKTKSQAMNFAKAYMRSH